MIKKDKKFYLIMFLGTILFLLLMIELAAQVKAIVGERVNSVDKSMYIFDSKLGWRLNDGIYRQSHYDFDATYTIMDGRRFTVNAPSKDCVKINLYGDSFIFGVGVNDEDVFASLISQSIHNVCINNYGVSGYGPLQYFIKHNETATEDSINIFFIYTGNDYQDVQRDKIEWGTQKPVLIKYKNNYRINYPEKNNFGIRDRKAKFKFRAINFIKTIAKSLPFIVKIRNIFAKPEENYVEEAINRFNFIFKGIDRGNTIFVILPSISLTLDISKNTNEGYFAKKLDDYLRSKKFYYINIHKEGLLSKSDFWAREGHNNKEGNEKIAKVISRFLKKNLLNAIKDETFTHKHISTLANNAGIQEK